MMMNRQNTEVAEGIIPFAVSSFARRSRAEDLTGMPAPPMLVVLSASSDSPASLCSAEE